jgi:hypothetical protein
MGCGLNIGVWFISFKFQSAILVTYVIICFTANHLNTIISPESFYDRYAVHLPAQSECQITIVYVTFTPPPLHIPSALYSNYLKHVYIFYQFNIIPWDWALKIDSLLDNNEIYNLCLKMF